MPRRGGERMMVVVPALAKGQKCYPPAVGGQVLCFVTAVSESVRRAVDEPGGVENGGDPHEHAPHYPRRTAHKVEQSAGGYDQRQEKSVQEDVESVFQYVAGHTSREGSVKTSGGENRHPTDMRPPKPARSVVRVVLFVTVSMMQTMNRDPGGRTGLGRLGGHKHDRLGEPRLGAIALVCEKPMIAKSDSHRRQGVQE